MQKEHMSTLSLVSDKEAQGGSMNPVNRVIRFFDAWVNFEQIRSLDLQHYTLEELVRRVMNFANGFFAPMQIESEIVEALEEIQKLKPKYIVELGSAPEGRFCFGRAWLTRPQPSFPSASRMVISEAVPPCVCHSSKGSLCLGRRSTSFAATPKFRRQ